MSDWRVLTYRDFARAVAKYPRTELLTRLADMAAAEARLRLGGGKPDPPVLWFSLAGVARTALAECRPFEQSSRLRLQVSAAQVEQLCLMHINVYDPPTEDVAPAVLTRIAFEQFGAQVIATENINRAHLLFHEYASAFPRMPTASDWESTLGCSLDSFLRAGWAVYVGALARGGVLTRDELISDEMRRYWEPLSAETFLDVVEAKFARPAGEHRRLCRETQLRDAEKWSFSSLVAFPLVSDGARYICPAPQLMLERISATGLWFDGWEQWHSRFSGPLGEVFETYVGDQLRLIASAQVLDQVLYTLNNSEARSCDWIVVTPEVVMLVEVKCARPVISHRVGEPDGLADTRRKLSEAVKQLETTAQRIAESHPAFSHIPANLPVRGLIVTLEPFYLLHTMRDEVAHSEVLPIGLVSSYDLELCTAALTDQSDAGAQILAALTRDDDLSPQLKDVAAGREVPANAILTRAWNAWATWAHYST